jgi:beta-glucosidase
MYPFEFILVPTFQGFVISDYQGLDFITTPGHADYLLSIKLGILAGIDMVIKPALHHPF